MLGFLFPMSPSVVMVHVDKVVDMLPIGSVSEEMIVFLFAARQATTHHNHTEVSCVHTGYFYYRYRTGTDDPYAKELFSVYATYNIYQILKNFFLLS